MELILSPAPFQNLFVPQRPLPVNDTTFQTAAQIW